VALRGRVGSGLKGAALATELDAFRADVAEAVARLDATPTSAFGPAFLASLGIILREGVEVILLLGMLVALAAKAAGAEGRRGAFGAIRGGVAGAVVASVATALALNLLVASSRGSARELIEGLVLLAAASLLFYVSYWLVSRSQARRWSEFLKQQARR